MPPEELSGNDRERNQLPLFLNKKEEAAQKYEPEILGIFFIKFFCCTHISQQLLRLLLRLLMSRPYREY
jgi:hypothetical protein